MKLLALDKQAHFWAGMAIYGLSVAVLYPLYAIDPVVVAAIGKELWDSRTHYADWRDAVATVAGGLVAYGWVFIVSFFG